jgi:hypothetical protein
MTVYGRPPKKPRTRQERMDHARAQAQIRHHREARPSRLTRQEAAAGKQFTEAALWLWARTTDDAPDAPTNPRRLT